MLPGFEAPNVHVVHMNKTEVARRVADALRAAGLPAKGARSVVHALLIVAADPTGLEHVYGGLKMNDVKPLYGAMLRDMLAPYTHWGWSDIACLLGDLQPLLDTLRHYDVVAYPDGVGMDNSYELASQ